MNAENDLRVIRYIIEMKTPVLVTDVQGEPNGAVSQACITGSLLRGALINAYLAENRQSDFDLATDAEARALFLGDDTRFLNAYPLSKPYPASKDGQRALPLPVAWRHNKDDQSSEGDPRTIYDFSREQADVRDEGSVGDFCWWMEKKAALYTTSRRINVHTQRDARKGRPTVVFKKDDEEEQVGAIYRYDALEAGLQMKAAIVTTEKWAKTLEDLLRGKTFWIGRARRAGYGKVEVIRIETSDYWRESDAGDSPLGVAERKKLRLTCTSDILLRDENGQTTFDLHAALAQSLNVKPDALTLDQQSTWVKTKIVGGFNRKWGTALPQASAIAAGSVFVYETTQAISADALETLELYGVGERRNEGLGRVIVNWLQRELKRDDGSEEISFESQEFKPESLRPKLDKLSSLEEKAARAIARRILRKRLNEKLLGEVGSTQIEQAPHKNQLARLRVILRAIQTGKKPGQAATGELFAYLGDLLNRRTSRKQFEKARVRLDDKPLLVTWIEEQINKAKEKWNVNPVKLGDDEIYVEEKVDDALAQEYALRLIDQVLYHATKTQD